MQCWTRYTKSVLIGGKACYGFGLANGLGIPKPGEYYARNADLIGGILWHLEEDGYVEDIGNNRWRITEKGVSKIEGV